MAVSDGILIWFLLSIQVSFYQEEERVKSGINSSKWSQKEYVEIPEDIQLLAESTTVHVKDQDKLDNWYVKSEIYVTDS